MIDHHIQRTIISLLVSADSERFRDLKPEDLENKAFTYHLQKVVKSGLVEKNKEGKYRLTEEGRRLGRRLADTSYSLSVKPHSVLFLVVRRKADGAWLLYKRKAHPLKDMVGFMHAAPHAGMRVGESASKELLAKTGLRATFQPMGGGFFHMYRDDQLESYTQFTLLISEDVEGELAARHEAAEYWWEVRPDFQGPGMLPNMPDLVSVYEQGKSFFLDRVYTIAD